MSFSQIFLTLDFLSKIPAIKIRVKLLSACCSISFKVGKNFSEHFSNINIFLSANKDLDKIESNKISGFLSISSSKKLDIFVFSVFFSFKIESFKFFLSPSFSP